MRNLMYAAAVPGALYRYDVHNEQSGGLWDGARTSAPPPGTPSTCSTAVCSGLRMLTRARTRLHRVWTHSTLVGLS